MFWLAAVVSDRSLLSMRPFSSAHRRIGKGFSGRAVPADPKEAKKMDAFIHYGIGAAVQAIRIPGWKLQKPMLNASELISALASAVCQALRKATLLF
jgi:3-oxoacyl-(acyl-carrier-protein) synthase